MVDATPSSTLRPKLVRSRPTAFALACRARGSMPALPSSTVWPTSQRLEPHRLGLQMKLQPSCGARGENACTGQ